MKENFLFFEKRKKNKHSNIRRRHRISRRDRTETTLKKNEKKNKKRKIIESVKVTTMIHGSVIPPPSLFSLAYVVSKASPCLSMLFFFRVRSFADNVHTRTSSPSPLGLPVVSTVREERTHQTALYTFCCFGLIDRKGTRSSVQKKNKEKEKRIKRIILVLKSFTLSFAVSLMFILFLFIYTCCSYIYLTVDDGGGTGPSAY